LTLKYIATARLIIPEIKIPVTTALETLDSENGRHRGLLAGSNALMFNLTPEKYCRKYNIYDHKYLEREKVWQKYGLFSGEESYEMLEERLMILQWVWCFSESW
jgi:biotin synthase